MNTKELIEFYQIGIKIKKTMYKSALDRLSLSEANKHAETRREYERKIFELENKS